MTQQTGTDLANLSGYSDTRDLLATRFQRGTGRQVYVIALPLHLVPSSLPRPNPDEPFEGNRTVKAKHAREFAEYWRSNEKWACPPIMLDTVANLVFEAKYSTQGVEVGILKLPHNSDGILDILDGQHRILGWSYAVEDVRRELKTWRASALENTELGNDIGLQQANEKVLELEALESRMTNEYVTMELMTGVSIKDHKQAFADISNNALGITKSKTVEFDSSSILNRLTRDLAASHPLLQDRVDFEVDRVLGQNTNILSARNVSDILRTAMLGLGGRMTKPREKTYARYETQLETFAATFFDTLSSAFEDLELVELGEIEVAELRKRSMVTSPTMLRVFAGAFHNVAVEMRDDVPTIRTDKLAEIEEFFKTLSPHMGGPVRTGNAWMTTGAFREEGGMAPQSSSQAFKDLTAEVTAWANGTKELPF